MQLIIIVFLHYCSHQCWMGSINNIKLFVQYNCFVDLSSDKEHSVVHNCTVLGPGMMIKAKKMNPRFENFYFSNFNIDTRVWIKNMF